MHDRQFNIALLTGFLSISLYIYWTNTWTLKQEGSASQVEPIDVNSIIAAKPELTPQQAKNINRAKGVFITAADGDTLTVRNTTGQLLKLRLIGIDAPEKDQPHGQSAKIAIFRLCRQQYLEFEPIDVDRYGRTIAFVFCNGVNVQAHMVENGHAWVYEKYVGDSQYLYKLQTAARGSKIGLWGNLNPIQPWLWRSVQK